MQQTTTPTDIAFASELIDAVIVGISTFGGGWYDEVQQIRARHPDSGALLQAASVAVWKSLSPRARRELHRRAKRARPRRRLGRTYASARCAGHA